MLFATKSAGGPPRYPGDLDLAQESIIPVRALRMHYMFTLEKKHAKTSGLEVFINTPVLISVQLLRRRRTSSAAQMERSVEILGNGSFR